MTRKNSVLEHFLHSVASWNTNFLFLVASSSSLTLKYFCVFSGKNILAYPTEIFILLVLDGQSVSSLKLGKHPFNVALNFCAGVCHISCAANFASFCFCGCSRGIWGWLWFLCGMVHGGRSLISIFQEFSLWGGLGTGLSIILCSLVSFLIFPKFLGSQNSYIPCLLVTIAHRCTCGERRIW